MGALAVVIGIAALPFVLSSGNTIEKDYKSEMAAWHVRWSGSQNAEERRSLLSELDEIRSPIGSSSIEMLDRHRIYEQAHIIYSQADDLAAIALQSVAATVSIEDNGQTLTCNNLESLLRQSPGNGDGAIEVTLARDACSLFGSAGKNLVIVRAQALSEWLRDEIRALSN
ncbi:MAG: hypothetical protein O3C69_05320 [Chloroflexi bacterium]|nr:hypothetical protein [Chloroflexota bacterium]